MDASQIGMLVFVAFVLMAGIGIANQDVLVRAWRHGRSGGSASLVTSEPEIQSALEHLRSLPFRPEIPRSWDRQRLVQSIKEAVGSKPRIGDSYDVAPGVFAIIKPFGVDLAGQRDFDPRLQIWLAVRAVGTDPERLVTL